MDLGVAGSIPVSHPIFVGGEPSGIGSRKDAPVAQLDRATVSGTVGQRFEPSQAYHFFQVGVGSNSIFDG